jgi:hypothetical protein
MHVTNWNGFKGAAKRLDDIDLPKIGRKIGVGEDEIHAFMEVESAGSGFDGQGRPKILFEPHWFYRLLSGAKLSRAVSAGLAYPKWGMKKYPRESYTRLAAALEIDETAALKATSWGLGQIMGVNHGMIGYASVQEMVREFMADEEAHLDGMIAFLKASKLDDDLRAHRWDVLARGYNGPGYAKHGYDKRLAQAFAKWSKIRDTPYTPGQDPPEAPEPAPTAPPVVAAPTPPPAPPSPVVATEPATAALSGWAWFFNLFRGRS